MKNFNPLLFFTSADLFSCLISDLEPSRYIIQPDISRREMLVLRPARGKCQDSLHSAVVCFVAFVYTPIKLAERIHFHESSSFIRNHTQVLKYLFLI